MPELKEDTRLNQVTLILKTIPIWLTELQELKQKIIENLDASTAQTKKITEILDYSIRMISTERYGEIDSAIKGLAVYMANISKNQIKKITETAKKLSNDMEDNKKFVYMIQNLV